MAINQKEMDLMWVAMSLADKKYSRKVGTPNTLKIITVVEKFIADKKLLCYETYYF